MIIVGVLKNKNQLIIEFIYQMKMHLKCFLINEAKIENYKYYIKSYFSIIIGGF